jgi:hypothetical protein
MVPAGGPQVGSFVHHRTATKDPGVAFRGLLGVLHCTLARAIPGKPARAGFPLIAPHVVQAPPVRMPVKERLTERSSGMLLIPRSGQGKIWRDSSREVC